MKQYLFKKTGNDWYINLPEFIEQGGSMGDLQMVEGADTMLDIVSEGKTEVTLSIARESFEGSDVLILTEKCDPYVGGGYYFMKEYNSRQVDKTMWLCQVTEFVFGDIPDQIFVRKEK